MLKERLRAARKQAGFTQKEVAEALGITESTYCGYETGKRSPDALKISKLASLLGVSGDYLLGQSDKMKKTPTSADGDGRDDEFIRLYQQLTDAEKMMLLAQIKGLLAGR